MILYGTEQSVLFPGQVWGGMSADTAIFTQAGLDLPSLLAQWDPAQRNQWRLFSKLGVYLFALRVVFFKCCWCSDQHRQDALTFSVPPC
jgi:hypothetical protein